MLFRIRTISLPSTDESDFSLAVSLRFLQALPLPFLPDATVVVVGEGVLLQALPLAARPACPAPFLPFFFGTGLATGFAVGFGVGFTFFVGSFIERVRVCFVPRPIILSCPIHSSCLHKFGRCTHLD